VLRIGHTASASTRNDMNSYGHCNQKLSLTQARGTEKSRKHLMLQYPTRPTVNGRWRAASGQSRRYCRVSDTSGHGAICSQSTRRVGLPLSFALTALISSAKAVGFPKRSNSRSFAKTASSTPTPCTFEIAIRKESAFRKRLIKRGLPTMPDAVVIKGARRSAVSNFPTSSGGSGS
jgi:hypothetical protein